MVDPALFRERTFSLAVGLGVIFNFCLYGSIFCLAIDLHRAHGLDALQTGLALLPLTIVTGAWRSSAAVWSVTRRTKRHRRRPDGRRRRGAAHLARRNWRRDDADRVRSARRYHRFGHAGHDRGGDEPRAARSYRAGVRCLQRLAPDRRCPRASPSSAPSWRAARRRLVACGVPRHRGRLRRRKRAGAQWIDATVRAVIVSRCGSCGGIQVVVFPQHVVRDYADC